MTTTFLSHNVQHITQRFHKTCFTYLLQEVKFEPKSEHTENCPNLEADKPTKADKTFIAESFKKYIF